jgi:hypothetical protein
MLVLIRYDGTNSRIILFYYYEMTSLPLTCHMKQLKTSNIEEKPYAFRQKQIPSLLPLHLQLLLLLLLLLYLYKSSLMSFYHTKYLVLT